MRKNISQWPCRNVWRATNPSCRHARFTGLQSHRASAIKPVMLLFFMLLPLAVWSQADTDVPLPPQNIRLADNLDGTVTLSWEAPGQVGAGGGYVNPSELTYNIYSRNYELIAGGLSATTCTFDAPAETSQLTMLLYRLTAVNSRGESQQERSNFLLFGPSLQLPYGESTPQGQPQQEWWTEQHADEPFQGSTAGSMDDDGGCTAWYSQQAGEDATTTSAKITLATAANPVLFFAYYAQPGQQLRFDVEINRDGRDNHVIHSVDFAALSGAAGWRTVSLPLNSFLDSRYVQLRFRAYHGEAKATTLLIDNIRIYDQPQTDIALRLVAPAKWVAGVTQELRAGLTNLGSRAVSQATVSLLADGDEVATLPVSSIPAGHDQTFSLSFKPDWSLPAAFMLSAEVIVQGDENPQNNFSQGVEVSLSPADHPAVTTLTVEQETLPVSLRWNVPDKEDTRKTEGFEDYAPWSTDALGAWTLVDGDGMPTFGIQGVDFPGEVLPKAFIVVNPGQMAYDPFYVDTPPAEDPLLQPHQGRQYLFCLNPDTYYDSRAQADDWLISPRLSGEAQTISLWARSFDDYDRETFHIMASQSLPQPDSFSALKTVSEASTDWTEYVADLPAGTRYFALHVTSADKWALMVDDITFTQAQPVVKGYGVYRDGKLVATVDNAALLRFVDTEADGGVHQYAVSVIYEDGESALSNIVTATVVTDGIETSRLSESDTPFDVYTPGGQLVRRNAKSLRGLPRGFYITKPASSRSAQIGH